jgi:Ca2+/Na+ antiporter
MLLIGVVLAAVFLMAVFRWWSEGIYEASDALLLAVVFCGLIFGLFAARTVPQRLLAFIPLLTAAAYAIYSYRYGGMRAYLKKRCQEHIRAIQFDPRNLGAREYLARSLHDLGELDRAIDEMQVAVDMGAGTESQYMLSRWTRERHLRESANPVCKWCMTENQPGARRCAKCGAALPYQSPLGRWLTGGRTAGARCYLIVVFGIALVSVSLLLLPIRYAFIPLALCLMALGGWSLAKS